MIAPEAKTLPDQDEDPISILELLKTIWLERRFIVLVSLVVAVIAAFHSYTIPNSYKAEVVIQIKGGSVKVGGGALAGLAAVSGIAFSGDQTIEATMGTLRSKELMRDLISRLKIDGALLGDEERKEDKSFSLTDFLWNSIGIGGTPKPDSDPTQRLELAREAFEGVMTYADDRKSGLSTISIKWKDPEIAANWANQFVAMANNRLRELAIDRAQKNLEHLNSELAKTSVVAVQQSIYRLIEEQVKSIMVATVEREFAIRVIDPATKPLRRYSPNRKQIVQLAGLVGLMLAVAAVFIRQRFFSHKPWPLGFLNVSREKLSPNAH